MGVLREQSIPFALPSSDQFLSWIRAQTNSKQRHRLEHQVQLIRVQTLQEGLAIDLPLSTGKQQAFKRLHNQTLLQFVASINERAPSMFLLKKMQRAIHEQQPATIPTAAPPSVGNDVVDVFANRSKQRTNDFANQTAAFASKQPSIALAHRSLKSAPTVFLKTAAASKARESVAAVTTTKKYCRVTDEHYRRQSAELLTGVLLQYCCDSSKSGSINQNVHIISGFLPSNRAPLAAVAVDDGSMQTEDDRAQVTAELLVQHRHLLSECVLVWLTGYSG
jgi:hypothetical protein